MTKLLRKQFIYLANFDASKPIIIFYIIASSYGVGAVLLQIDKKGEKEIISYAARLLSGTERRYAQIKREALTLTWAFEKFQEYVIGIPILLKTDHKSLL